MVYTFPDAWGGCMFYPSQSTLYLFNKFWDDWGGTDVNTLVPQWRFVLDVVDTLGVIDPNGRCKQLNHYNSSASKTTYHTNHTGVFLFILELV